jgi:serine/threonine protein kinase
LHELVAAENDVTNLESQHPGPERLIAFRMGRLNEAEGMAVRNHLADCSSCRSMADALDPQTLSALLQGPASRVAHGTADTPSGPPASESATVPPATAAASRSLAMPAELAEHPRYRVQRLLGAGGMGCVYLAEHRLMERPVALKVISRQLTEDAAAVERFQREMRSAARLAHPHIVTAYDAEQAHGLHFLVMEYVDGTSLDRLVAARGALPVAEACNYIRQAALGLQHAHEKGMIHRDIKPQNLMRDGVGNVKILDFGLARFLSESKPVTALTQTGTVMGTPDYISPEQAHDARAADIRSDIYSLGCALYFLLAGQAPFPDGSVLQKLMAHVEKTPRPLRELRNDVPVELARIVERMMAKDPAKRYQTPGEVASVLTPFATAAQPATIPIASLVPDNAPRSATPVWPAQRTMDAGGPSVLPVSSKALLQDRPPALRSTGSQGLAVVSLVLGILAFPLGCVPCVGVLSMPFSAVGALLGLGALVTAWNRPDRRVSTAIAGLAVNLVSLMFAYAMTFGFGPTSRKGVLRELVPQAIGTSIRSKAPARDSRSSSRD